jgi:serine/threonine protein kinase/Tfp pilus assembly protein PilF
MTDPHDLQPTAAAPPAAGDAPAAGTWQLPGGRYQVLGEIARGGMGVVLRVIDTDIQRPLAVKVMRAGAAPELQERFLEEARITGQLQHPGIPPVHEIGRLADGRPFFSMKLIEGRTLSALLRERPSPQADLPHFLKIFEQIAQTLAYAHSQGIIHRDLKPLNVMVGAFGEVQVMDWGLARRLRGRESFSCEQDRIVPPSADRTKKTPDPLGLAHQGADAPRSPPVNAEVTTEVPGPLDDTRPVAPQRDERDDSDRLTQAGQVLGTPAYMPPEQARGEIDILDERSDVFGLGAILCVILTGAPPYRGPDQSTTLRYAQQGNLADADERLQACGADAELAALCRECLAVEPAQRPRHAGEVAARMSTYLASVQERLRAAEIAHAAAQAKAEEERRVRRRNAIIAVGVVCIFAVLSAVGFWVNQQKAIRATGMTTALDEAQRQIDELHARLRDERQAAKLLSDLNEWQALLDSAQAAWKRADALAAGGRMMVSSELRERLARLADQLQADERDRQLALELDKIRFESSVPVDGQILLWRAAPKLAKVFQNAGYNIEQDDPANTAIRIRQSTIRLPLVAALDFWALVTRDGQLRQWLLEVARAADPDPWRDRVRQANRWKDVGYLRDLAEGVDFTQQTPQLLSALAQRLRTAGGDAPALLRRAMVQHPRDFWLFFELGHASTNPVEQAGAFRAALAIRPESVYAYYSLGVVHASDQKLKEAEDCYRRALALDANYAAAMTNLGLVLEGRQRIDEAIELYRRAIEVEPTSVHSHSNLGAALYAQGKVDEAVASCREALTLEPGYAPARINLGVALRVQGKLDEAIEQFEFAIAAQPVNPIAWCNLGHALRQQGKFYEALRAFHRGHELRSRERNWTWPSAHWIKETQQWIAVDEKLPALLRGETVLSDPRDNLAAADLCVMNKKRFAAAARFYAAAFAGAPTLAADSSSGQRYNAACAASLAAAGQGLDARELTAEERATLRRQALGWLRAELAAWTSLLEKQPQDAPTVARTLAHWQTDPDLSGVRDDNTVKSLPPDEQKTWRQLWNDVEALRKQADAEAAKSAKP